MDARLAAYYATPQFAEYLQEKARWESAHAAYSANPNPQTRNQLTIRQWAMDVCLASARRTDEHRAAFGW